MKIDLNKNHKAGLFVLGAIYPLVTGGMEVFNYYFLKHQVKDGHTIYYLSNNSTDTGEGNFVLLKKIWPFRLFYPFQFFFTVKKLRKKIGYVYISFADKSWVISFSQALTLRLFKIPYVITIHWGKEPTWKFKYPFMFFFKKAHAVIGVSEPVCKAYKKVLGRKDVFFIPPLIPFEPSSKSKPEAKMELGYDKEEKIILFAGTLKPMKNPEILLLAMKQVEESFLKANKIRLLFAGNGEMLAGLKASTRELRLTEYIRFDGLISRQNMPTYFKAADCYIISSDYEGTSISLLEAMYNRLPIIASDAPGINSMIIHNRSGLLYNTKDSNALAKNLKKIFSDANLAETLAQNAYLDYIKNYSYQTMVAQYNAIFSAAIS